MSRKYTVINGKLKIVTKSNTCYLVAVILTIALIFTINYTGS